MDWLDAHLIPALDGVAYGMLLFVVAAGLTLAFGSGGVLNLAHGTVYAMGAYIAADIGDGSWGMLVLALAVGAAAGATSGGVLAVAVAPVARRGHLDQALLTFGIALVGGDMLVSYFGADQRQVAVPKALEDSVTIAGHQYPTYRLAFIGVAALLAGLGYWLLVRSTAGAAVRATTDDPEMVAALGLSPRVVHTATLVVAGALAGGAGVLGAPIITPSPETADTVMLWSLIIVVVGRLGSVLGALFAAIAVGEVQTLGVVLAPDLAPYLLFGAMGIALLVRSGSGILPEFAARARVLATRARALKGGGA
ncbi:branched-chain amino acid ABC transporter permease [Yinghuangia seranimata]|uniref:branched-chain amino acid ABC transporter permease n=1 Tax=Yinghuangia seranimata TaxID=408067 RepID=UPI003CCFD6D2